MVNRKFYLVTYFIIFYMEKDNELDIDDITSESSSDKSSEEGSDIDEFDDDEDEVELVDENEKELELDTILTDIVIPNTKFNDDSSDDEDADDEDYFKKFEKSSKDNIILQYHPEIIFHTDDEIQALTLITRNKDGSITDSLHSTLPFFTKYEKTSLIGIRTAQINNGGHVFVDVPVDVMDGYLIAVEEYKQKKIPFILKRPLPNGTCEYWKACDLEII